MKSASRFTASAITLVIVLAAPASGDVIAKPRGIAPASTTSLLVDAITRKYNGSTLPRVVELTGSSSADAALLLREGTDGTLFALGPDAVVAAKGIDRKVSIVALNVPNPDRLPTNATYISVYPDLDQVTRFIARLRGKTVGLVFTPSQNHEVAIHFASAARSAGVTPLAIPVSGANVATVVRDAVQKVNVLVLLIDPLLFDARSLNEIISAAARARVPTIGFLPELPALGVTIALVPPVEAVAGLAVKSVGNGTKHTVEVEQMDVMVSKKSAQEVGLDLASIGPHSLR